MYKYILTVRVNGEAVKTAVFADSTFHAQLICKYLFGVNNVLNNTNIITNGYEQLRFDFAEKNINKFAPKAYYGFGTNYFVNFTLRFN
jgi:hypothetical protein